MPELNLGRVTATINGKSTVTITAKSPVQVTQDGSTLSIGLTDELSKVSEGLSSNYAHKRIFRGKNIGTALTDAQKEAIKAGTFTDMYLGDFWHINGIKWRIVDVNYWLNAGDVPYQRYHLVIMPDATLGAFKQMNATDTTEGGYVGSLMYTTNMDEAKSICMEAFGENIITHREYLVNAVANGKPSAGGWLDSTIELPSEIMIYGHPHFAPANDGTTMPDLHTIDKVQFAMFAADSTRTFLRSGSYWLRDVVSSKEFANVTNRGVANHNNAAFSTIGVRPVFGISY